MQVSIMQSADADRVHRQELYWIELETNARMVSLSSHCYMSDSEYQANWEDEAQIWIDRVARINN